MRDTAVIELEGYVGQAYFIGKDQFLYSFNFTLNDVFPDCISFHFGK